MSPGPSAFHRRRGAVSSRRYQALRAACLTITLGAAPLAFLGAAEEIFVAGEISALLLRDIDLDGRDDILVSFAASGQRSVALFRNQKRFSAAPDQVVPIDPQAIFFAVRDYDPAPGLELVLMSRSSGVLLPLVGTAPPRRLLACEAFFNLPSREELPAWFSTLPLDLDADGTEDFIVAERDRLKLLFGPPRPARDFAWGGDVGIDLAVQFYTLVDGRQERIRRSVADFAGLSGDDDYLLQSAGAFPFPIFKDFDGNGLTDVIVKTAGRRLDIHFQTQPRRFSRRSLGEQKWLKGTSSVSFRDVNGDGKLDVIASQLLLRDLATEVRVYLQDPADEELGLGRPHQILRSSGFFSRPRFGDSSGDGRADLIVTPYRVDLLEQLKRETVDEVEISYQVYEAAASGGFKRRPTMQRDFVVRTGVLEASDEAPIVCDQDFDGDGRVDVLYIDRGGLLRLECVRGEASLEEERSAAARVRNPRRIRTGDLDARPGVEALLVFERSVQIHRLQSP